MVFKRGWDNDEARMTNDERMTEARMVRATGYLNSGDVGFRAWNGATDCLSMAAMKAKLPRGTLDRLWSDPANWRAGAFYYCPDDPRGIVPKRRPVMGWTMNCAQASGWFAVLAVVAYPLGLVLWLHAKPEAYWLIPALGILTLIIIPVCKFMASTQRFEE